MGGGTSKSEGRKTQVKEGDRIPNVVLQIRVFKVDEKNCGGEKVVVLVVMKLTWILPLHDENSSNWGISQNLTEEKEDSSNPLNPGNFRRVKLVPDGAAAFTRSMGMT
eukprot:gene30811-37225_t